MTISDQVTASIRTGVSMAVGAGAGVLVTWGVEVTEDQRSAVVGAVMVVVGLLWHAAASAAQRRWPTNPLVRVLLGVGKPPSYTPPPAPAAVPPGVVGGVEVTPQALLDEWDVPAVDPWTRPARRR